MSLNIDCCIHCRIIVYYKIVLTLFFDYFRRKKVFSTESVFFQFLISNKYPVIERFVLHWLFQHIKTFEYEADDKKNYILGGSLYFKSIVFVLLT